MSKVKHKCLTFLRGFITRFGAGLDEEARVPFTDHIFVEEHLEAWCPKAGPVRVFMELVCVGLSKNPWLTVEQKKEHIEWYRNYFDEKQDVLQRMITESAEAPAIEQK